MIDDLPEVAVRLAESDGFRRAQVIEGCDEMARLHGELAVLRRRLKGFEEVTVGEMQEALKGKDAQIEEQSRTIVALRARVAELGG